ncbi:unnamed protein product [Paramecium sonneborni]|uniref:Protein kinase domain-containing protein n=1 Tax=Paramecium sonneborni TaxID=65129 RepID=A0A8S1REB1_9CILI|nr:unnamed protein product [Paramecium sonneborni]
MKIANYQIELPISSEYSYQLIYRGIDQNKQSYYINIFPKSELDSIMYQNIQSKLQFYNYIKDAYEDDENVLISYSNSDSWIKMPSKITNDQFNTYLKQLYDLYSLDSLGFYDFNPDFLYINQKTIYIIDYGLRYSQFQIKYQQKHNSNYQQSQFMKTWMFGSMLYCLTTGTKDPSFLIKLNQQQINYHIEYNCRQNNISEDNINFLKLLLQVDFNLRPAFDYLTNLPLLQSTKINKIQSPQHNNQQRTIQKLDKLNQGSIPQFSKYKFNHSQSTFIPTMHHSKVQIALKKNFSSFSQKQLKQSKINQYQYANQLIKSNLTNKHQILKNISTTKSFFTPNQMQNNSSVVNEQTRQNNRFNQKNLTINMDTIKPSRSTSVNTKSQEHQSNAQTNQMVIQPKQENNFEFKQKPKKNQINSFEQDFFFKEEDDEEDLDY